MKLLYIAGASGQGREVASALRDAEGLGRPVGRMAGFLDDEANLHGVTIAGLPVLGGLGNIPSQREQIGLILGVGYPEAKSRIVRRIGTSGSWPTVIHPASLVGQDVQIGNGCFIQAGAVLTTDIRLDGYVTINVGATVSHDCSLGMFATISPGANLGGSVEVGEGCFVGIGAAVAQGVRLGPWSVVGAGAVVIRDVPANAVVAGVPARVLRMREHGWQEG